MRVKLSKKLLIETYCYARQGERSVDRALLNSDWNDFLEYYNTQMRTRIRRVIDGLDDLVPPGTPCPPKAQLPKRQWIAFTSKPFNRWKQSWRFSAEELAFLRCAMRGLLQTITAIQKPQASDLVSVRTSLYVTQWCIDQHAAGLPQLILAKRVEHWLQPDFLRMLPLDQIVDSPLITDSSAVN